MVFQTTHTGFEPSTGGTTSALPSNSTIGGCYCPAALSEPSSLHELTCVRFGELRMEKTRRLDPNVTPEEGALRWMA